LLRNMVETKLLINDLKRTVLDLTRKSLLWWIGIVIFLAIIPLLLILLQYFVVLEIIPPEFTIKYLRIDFSEPNFFSMFFSNYIHNVFSIDHLMKNYWGYVSVSLTSVILCFIIIPFCKKQDIIHLEYPDMSFWATLIVIFLAFPFAESGISIYFGRILLLGGKWGISGIIWALSAYLFFIIIKILYDIILFNIRTKGENVQELILILICISFFIVIVPIYGILYYLGNPQIGVFGHFAGYTLGLLISVIVGSIFETKKVEFRLTFLLLVVLTIIIPSIFWIFFNPPSPFITPLTQPHPTLPVQPHSWLQVTH